MSFKEDKTMANESFKSKKMLYRVSDLIDSLGISETTIWRWRRSGYFPKPIQLGPRLIAWKAEDIEEWIRFKE